MQEEKQPQGLKFSLLYLDRRNQLEDSPRARRRVAAQVDRLDVRGQLSVMRLLKTEVGASIPSIAHIDGFIRSAGVIDFLDSITVLCQVERGVLLEGVSRIFREENLRYTIDPLGGVHFGVDEEFAANTGTAVAALGAARYRAVATAFEHAQRGLTDARPDLKTALRSTFEAVEILFKLIVTTKGVQRIGADELRQHLTPILDKHYGSDEVGRRAASKMQASLADWVDGVHFYRHGQKEEEPTPPPLDLTVLMVSQGASYLRWLVTLDASVN